MPVTVAEILQEFDLECATTRRVLERVPADQLNLEAAREVDVTRTACIARGSGARADQRVGCAGLVGNA